MDASIPLTNQTCEVCKEDPASLFCSCSPSPTLLCSPCFTKHQTSAPLVPHLTMHISLLGRDPEEYQQALRKLNKGKAELRLNVERMEQCSQELTQSIGIFIDGLIEYRDRWTQWIQSEKQQLSATVEAAIQEAEGCLLQRTVSVSPLAQALLSLPSEQLRVFSYTLTSSDLQITTKDWVNWQNNLPGLYDYLRQQVIADPSALSINFHAVKTINQSKGLSEAQSSNLLEITEAMKVNFHRPSEECFEKRIQEQPKTIGRHRLPLESLQNEYRYNTEIVRQLQSLSSSFSTWRRNKGDANNFYRCIGVLLLEHYCRPDTPLQELYQLNKDVISGNLHFIIPDRRYSFPDMAEDLHLAAFIKLFSKMIKQIYSMRTRNENAFQFVQYCFQRSTVDIALCLTMRTFTSNYLSYHSHENPFNSHFDLPACIDSVANQGEDISETVILAAARCFSVVLQVLTLNTSSELVLSEGKYGPVSDGWYPSFTLLNRSNRFECLIRGEVSEADRYDFTTNVYAPVSTGQVIGYQLFTH